MESLTNKNVVVSSVDQWIQIALPYRGLMMINESLVSVLYGGLCNVGDEIQRRGAVRDDLVRLTDEVVRSRREIRQEEGSDVRPVSLRLTGADAMLLADVLDAIVKDDIQWGACQTYTGGTAKELLCIANAIRPVL